MAKKSQTRARRSNTQVGPQVVNFYNHGTVNVDARQSNSTTIKNEHTGCTFNYPVQQIRPFTLKDQIEDEHPILGKISTVANEPALPEVSTSVAIPNTDGMDNWKSSLWGYLAVGATIALVAVTATVKYFNN